MTFVEELQEEALRPFTVHRGTPYPTTQADIDFHAATKFSSDTKQPRLDQVTATAELLRHNCLYTDWDLTEQEAIDELLALVQDVKDGYRWGPDLAIKCFRDLDLVFFGGKLEGNVCVKWSHKDSSFGTKMFGITKAYISSPGRARIIMSTSLLSWEETPPFETMICVLLHEMCHAYDCVMSSYPNLLWNSATDAHGKHFCARLTAVHKRAVKILGIGTVGLWEDYRDGSWGNVGCGCGDHVRGEAVRRGVCLVGSDGKGGREGERYGKKGERRVRERRVGREEKEKGCVVM